MSTLLDDILDTIHKIPGVDFHLCKFNWNHASPDKVWFCKIDWTGPSGTSLKIERTGPSAEAAADAAFTEFQSITRYGIPQRVIMPHLIEAAEAKPEPGDEISF